MNSLGALACRRNRASAAGSWRLSRRRWRSPWSPELDDAGNSLAGVAMLEKLTQRMGGRCSDGRSGSLVCALARSTFAHASVWGKSGNIVSIRDRRSLIGMPQTLFASGWRPLRRSMMASRRRCAVTRCLSPSTRPLPAVAVARKMACHSPRPRAERAGAGLYRAGHPPLAGATNECAVCALICI